MSSLPRWRTFCLRKTLKKILLKLAAANAAKTCKRQKKRKIAVKNKKRQRKSAKLQQKPKGHNKVRPAKKHTKNGKKSNVVKKQKSSSTKQKAAIKKRPPPKRGPFKLSLTAAVYKVFVNGKVLGVRKVKFRVALYAGYILFANNFSNFNHAVVCNANSF